MNKVYDITFLISNRDSTFYPTGVVDPRVPVGSDHYFHTDCLYVRTSVRPSVPKLQNHSRPGLWAGRVDQ